MYDEMNRWCVQTKMNSDNLKTRNLNFVYQHFFWFLNTVDQLEEALAWFALKHFIRITGRIAFEESVAS